MSQNNSQTLQIQPMSERRKRKTSGQSAMNQTQKMIEPNWHQIFSSTYLSMYEKLATDKSSPLNQQDYDFVFDFGDIQLCVLIEYKMIQGTSLNMPKDITSKTQQKMAMSILHRQHRLQLKRLSTKVFDNTMTHTEPHIHYVGLTQIVGEYEGKFFPIGHEYGSQFFQESCVLDLDDKDSIVQFFGIGSFVKLLNVLQTPSDLLAFLEHQRQTLINQNYYVSEVVLAQNFLTAPEFFQRAIKVQEKLVEIGLLHQVEQRLRQTCAQASNEAEIKLRVNLANKLQSHSQMFHKLIKSALQRRKDVNEVLPKSQAAKLIYESMYTRTSIMEELMAYGSRSKHEKQQGYLAHQHSYNNFGVHYVVIVYGLAQEATFSRDLVRENHEQMLMDINSQLQNPVMKDYFLLGFDMSKHDGKGNVSVEMDVYYQPGATMSEMEKRLYAQIQALAV